MPFPRTLLTAAALGAAILVPSAAHAAEGFTAVTVDGQVSHLQSDAVPDLKPVPVKVTGLAAGERIVGLDRAPSGELLALTSAGKIDSLDASTGKATAKFAGAAAQGAFVAQTTAGAATIGALATLPFPGNEPVRSTAASDGSVWTTATLGTKPGSSKQSRLVRYDPATGRMSGQNGVFLFVKIAAIASDGQVADDHTAPRATFSDKVLRRKVSRGNAYFQGLRIKVDEGGQTTASLRYRGKLAGFGLVSLDRAGSSTLQIGPRKAMGATLRKAAAAHRRALVHLTVHDWAGNKRVYDVPVRLSL